MHIAPLKHSKIVLEKQSKSELKSNLESLLFNLVTQVKAQSLENKQLSLVSGLSSNILFLYSFNKFYPEYLSTNIIEEQLLVLFEQAQTAELNSSLADGISGLGWLLDHLGLNAEEDQNDDIDECLLEILSRPTWENGYELLYGLVGIGIYAVQRSTTPTGKAICKKVFYLLQSLATVKEGTVFWETDVSSPFFKSHIGCPQVDLGLAHGNAGVLGLLIKFYESNIFPEKCRSLIQMLSNYFQQQVRQIDNISSLPSHAGDKTSSLLGWCYGDLSSSLLFIKAGKQLELVELYQLGESIALKTLNRNKENENSDKASLCHGYSGIALIYMRLYQETNKKEFLVSCHYWATQLIQINEAEKNLKKLMPRHKESSEYFDGSGLLIGYAGIGLAILSIIHPTASGWDEFLLLS